MASGTLEPIGNRSPTHVTLKYFQFMLGCDPRALGSKVLSNKYHGGSKAEK